MGWLTNSYRFGVPGPGVGGTHRYWEIYQIANLNGDQAIAEVEMAATVGGADLCTGGTPYGAFDSANGAFGPAYSAPEAAKAFNNDGNTSSAQVSGTSGASFGLRLGYDFGTPVYVAEFRIQAGTPFAFGPNTFVLRGSDDFTNWTTYLYETNTIWASTAEVKSFPLSAAMPTSGRANAIGWRCFMQTNNGGSFFQVNDLIFAATVGGASLNTQPSGVPGAGSSGIPFGSAAYASYNGNNFEKGMDGSAGSSWAHNVSTNAFLGFAFPAIQDIAQMRIYAQPGVNAPQDFKAQYTTDWCSWTDAASFTGQTGWGGAYRDYSVP